MKLRFTAIAALLIGILLSFWTPPAIAANKDDLNRLFNTSSCAGCDISGAILSEVNLPNADLSHANLAGADLTKAILKGTDLSHANLQGAKFQNTDLSNTNLSGADLSNTQLSSAILSNAQLTGANLSNAQLKGTRFWGFAGYANLSSANLTGADLQGADLSSIKLLDANLTNADLSHGANLRDASLNGANLNNANLVQANLINARLNHANLQAAQLAGANLRKANLTKADLTGAGLRDINLTDTILTDTLGLDPYAEQLVQQATTTANNEDYLAAIAYLQKVPSQTQIYNQARTQLSDYLEKQQIKEQQQRDTEAAEQLKMADTSAASGDYKRAISLIKRIPKNTSAYQVAQAKIPSYEANLQEANAEKLVKDAEWWADSGNYSVALDKLSRVPAKTIAYSVAQHKITEYKQKQEESSTSFQSKPQDTSPEVMLAAIDHNHFGKTFPLSVYQFSLGELSRRCSANELKIADMSVSMTEMLRKHGTSFDNLSFLNQAIEATEDGVYGKCTDIFAILATLIQSESD